MLKTYFKLAYRNIVKDKAYSIINITGLAIGLASSILILLWVQNELSYDKFHKNAGQVYRLACDCGDSKTVGTPAGMPAELKAGVPVIKNTVRIKPANTTLLEAGTKKFEEERLFLCRRKFYGHVFLSVNKRRPYHGTKTDRWCITNAAYGHKILRERRPYWQDHTERQ